VHARLTEHGPIGLGTYVEDLIAEQVAMAPDAIAVRDRSGHLTYAELAERAGRLAG
jgi:non-ribosomal peptide synthetase component F